MNENSRRAVRMSFRLAWIDFLNERGIPLCPWEPYLARHENELVEEVLRHARTPRIDSPRGIRDLAMRPDRIPRYTRDDGVPSMAPGQVKNILLDWLRMNYR